MNKNQNTPAIILLLIILALLLMCCCLVLLGGAAWFGQNLLRTTTESYPGTALPFDPTATPKAFSTPEALNTQSVEQAEQTLSELTAMLVPVNDPIDLAERLGGKQNVPSTLPDPDAPYKTGDRKEFWATNTDTNENFKVSAVLRYVGDNIYFWIEDGVDYNQRDLQQLAETFDQSIIPTDREFFGSEWNPGVDGDPRFFVLYASGLGSSIAGYYSSADELHPDAHPYSNAHEMFMINSDSVALDDDYIYGTMAHEFQHMIHWYQDKNEETWVNEGFSMLAEQVNGYDAGGFDYEYMLNSDLQLNDWGSDPAENTAHYGASYLFMSYFLDRFGEDATKALVAHKENGFVSIGEVAQELNLINPDTGQPYTSDEIFADWAVSNYLQNSGIEAGRYDYQSYSPYRMSASQTVSSCPADLSREVFQYGVNYIEIDCPGTYTLSFTGLQSVKLLPFDGPTSGDYFFWSNAGDESNMSLSHSFDLSSISGPVYFNFNTWYDLETDYDYVFISASTDGQNWDILQSETCTESNPSGNSYGCGWNGQSDGWIAESVDLSAYAGQTVTVRFDYVTDAAVNGKGFALDDPEIQAIGYASDLEADGGGWDAAGFVRVQNLLPQTYSLRLITIGRNPTVTVIPLQADMRASLPIEIGGGTERVVLVISGTTPVTREKAYYNLNLR